MGYGRAGACGAAVVLPEAWNVARRTGSAATRITDRSSPGSACRASGLAAATAVSSAASTAGGAAGATATRSGPGDAGAGDARLHLDPPPDLQRGGRHAVRHSRGQRAAHDRDARDLLLLGQDPGAAVP